MRKTINTENEIMSIKKEKKIIITRNKKTTDNGKQE